MVEQGKHSRFGAKKWQVILLAVVILVSGIVIGSAGTIFCLRNRIVRGQRRPGRAGREGAKISQQIQTEYGLTDEQAKQVEELFSQRLEAMRAVRMEMAKQFSQDREKLLVDMNDILTPEQYEKWLPDFKNRAKHFPPRRGGRPHRRRPKDPNSKM